MPKLMTLLINLDGSDDRLAAADAQMRQAGLEYERFPAFDARGKDPKSFAEYSDIDARFWYGRALRGGEIGCFFSHLHCLEKFLASDAEFALLVEDDVEFDPQFSDFLKAVLGILSGPDAPGWDALNFGEPGPPRYQTPLWPLPVRGRRVQLCRAHLFPLNTHCILWSREGARAFLEGYGRMWKPVDHSMRHLIVRRNTGLSLTQAVAHQSEAPSDIDAAESVAGGRDSGETAWYWFHVWRIKRLERIHAKRQRRQLAPARRRARRRK